ncbi:MAG: hypothetical protein ACPIOQ_48460 [Promethearchaeia archaeon]
MLLQEQVEPPGEPGEAAAQPWAALLRQQVVEEVAAAGLPRWSPLEPVVVLEAQVVVAVARVPLLHVQCVRGGLKAGTGMRMDRHSGAQS